MTISEILRKKFNQYLANNNKTLLIVYQYAGNILKLIVPKKDSYPDIYELSFNKNNETLKFENHKEKIINFSPSTEIMVSYLKKFVFYDLPNLQIDRLDISTELVTQSILKITW